MKENKNPVKICDACTANWENTHLKDFLKILNPKFQSNPKWISMFIVALNKGLLEGGYQIVIVLAYFGDYSKMSED